MASQSDLFLSVVVPWKADTFVNIHAFELGEGNKLIPRASRATTSRSEALGFVHWCDSKGWEVYFCVSNQKNAGVGKADKRGRTVWRAMRGLDNADSLKAFFLDIDLKPGGYDTLGKVAEALQALSVAIGIPLPSIAVYSGGGLHAYWVLDQAVTLDVWRPLAHRLAEACRVHGLNADHGVTVDAARILRVPGTHNRKYGAPRPVTLEVLGGKVPLAIFEQALQDYVPTGFNPDLAQNLLGRAESFMLDPLKFPIRGDRYVLGRFTDGIFDDTPTLEELAAEGGCPFIRDTLASEGKDQREPLWFRAGHVAVFTRDGLDDYHRLSRGHAGYSPEATVEKYARILNHKLVKDQGWPRCATIENDGATQCATCQHRSQNKSPLNFAVRITSEPEVTQVSSPSPGFPQGAVNNGGKYQPHKLTLTQVRGYLVDANGIYSSALTDDDGNTITVPLWDYPMWNLERRREVNGQYALHWDTVAEYDTWAHVCLPVGDTGNYDRLHTCLGRHGLAMRPDQQRGLVIFMASFQQQMQAMKLKSSNQELMGWSDGPDGKPTGFIYGPTRYNCNGNSPFHQPDKILRDLYFPTGTIDAYRAAMKMANDEHRPEADLLTATAFAAPLMRFTGQSGVVISAYSSGSARHKSTFLKIGQSVWGSHRAINQLTDTENAVIERAGRAKVMPVYFDEMKASVGIEKFHSMVYTFAGGRGKARLNRNAEIKDVGTWDTLLIGASNDSLVSYMAAKDRTTEAGVNRIFEFQVSEAPKSGLTVGEAGAIIKALEANYGHAGMIYAEHLGKSIDWLPGRVTDVMNLLQKELKTEDDERFWLAAAAALLIGAQLANDLNLARYDIGRMTDFIHQTLHSMRGVRAFGDLDIALPANVLTLLQGYLNSQRRTTLVTDTAVVPHGRRSPLVPNVRVYNAQEAALAQQLTIQHAVDDKKLRISKRHFSEWLLKGGVPPARFVGNLNTYFGATERITRIGPGTPFAGAQERMIELDLNHPQLINLFDV